MNLETWVREHEVKCTERYTQLLEQNGSMKTDVKDLKTWLHRRMDWLLAIVCALAMTRVWEPVQIAEFIKAIFR